MDDFKLKRMKEQNLIKGKENGKLHNNDIRNSKPYFEIRHVERRTFLHKTSLAKVKVEIEICTNEIGLPGTKSYNGMSNQ